MSLSSSSKQNIALKKLVGKAHTSNFFDPFNEGKPSGVSITSSTVLASEVPSNPSNTNLYDITSDIVEYVRLVATPLNESLNSDNKYHAFKLSLPADYEANSTFANKGDGTFDNSKDIFDTSGRIQLIPPTFADSYEAKLYYGGNSDKGSGTRIPLLDERTWYLDYFNGILFQQTPPDNSAENPSYVEAFIYIGKMASERFAEGSATTLNELTDVNINQATAENQFLVHNGTGHFVNRLISSSDLSNDASLLKTTSSIADLNDVNTLTDIGDGNVLAWNAANNRFEFTAPAVTYTDEEARNSAGSALANSANHVGISFVNNDVNNTIDATVSLSGFSIGDLSNVDITTNAPNNNQILKWDNVNSKFVPSDDTGKTEEEIQDIVGEMVNGGTETDITVTYDDDSGKLGFVVNDTIARLASPEFTGTPLAPTAGLGTNTTQVATTQYVQSEISDLSLGSASRNDTEDFLAAGSSINVLSDVDISSVAPTEGQVLKWDNVNSKFIPSNDIGRTDEAIQDIVGGQLVTNGSHTGLTATYDDENDGAIDFAIDDTIVGLLSGNQTFTGDKTFTGAVDLTGSTATASTKDPSDNSTSLATTAYVDTQIDADIAALNLATTYQPLDAGLTSISGLTTAADKLIYTTAADTYAVSDLTSFARSILDDANAGDVRTTLELGTAAVQDEEYFLLSDSDLNNLADVLISNPANGHILVYDDDAGENDDQWKNVALSGDITITNSGVATIGDAKVTNSKLENSHVQITDGTTTDNLPLGQALTFNSVNNETTVTVSADEGAGADGVSITIGLPDDVTIGQDLTVTRDLVVTRNFTVNGTSSTISTTNLDVEDSIISLNNGLGDNPNPETRDIGLFFDRGNLDPALVFWDEADDVFKLGTHSGDVNSTSTDFADEDFTLEALQVKTVAADSNDNSVATTSWVSNKVDTKITEASINDLSDVNTAGKAEGKILKFNADGNLEVADDLSFTADTSSLWEVSDDGTELYPHGIIDGTLDTGMFAINLSGGSIDFTDLNVTLYDVLEELSSINSYTPSTKNQNSINDTYFEFDADGNIMPKAAS